MGESTLEWAKRQKVSASQTSRTNAVCEDCGRKWTATLTEVPVTIFIKDLDEYYKKLSKNLLEAVEPEMVLCVFRPSDRDVTDSEVTLSVVAPRQDSPYHWRINHKFSGPAAASGCQITIWKADQSSASISHEVCIEPDIVTIKQEIKEEMKEEDELMVEEVDFDPLARHRIDDPDDPDPDWTNSDTDTQSTGPQRFHHHSTIQELQSLTEKRLDPKTNEQTKWGISVFKSWLEERCQLKEFEHLSPAALDELLGKFYIEVRQVTGEQYSQSGLRCIRSAIQRYLQCDPWNRSIFINKDREFCRSNNILGGIFKKMASEGRLKKNSHTPVTAEDMAKLSMTGVIRTDNPKSLQRLVWLSLALHYGKLGQEGSWRNMTKNTIMHSVDSEGNSYLEYSQSEEQEKHLNVNTANYRPEARIYARPGNSLCPVAAFDKYLSLLNPGLDILWQKPNMKWEEKGGRSWYSKVPLGIHTLNRMFKSMSVDAGMSRIYTNHCLRITATKRLVDAGYDKTDICIVSGHQNIKSIEPYMKLPNEATKKKLSSDIGNMIFVDDIKTNENCHAIDIQGDCKMYLVPSEINGD